MTALALKAEKSRASLLLSTLTPTIGPMTRSPRQVLVPALAPWLRLAALCLGGCAVSSIADDEGAIDLDLPDSSIEANENPATGDDGEDDSDDSDDATPPKRDAGGRDAGVTSGAKDAGGALKDGGPPVKDAGSPAKDSGTVKPAVDAGTTSPPPASGNSCRQDSDCTQSCVPIGILTCCKADRSCGCTWAPGAYCL